MFFHTFNCTVCTEDCFSLSSHCLIHQVSLWRWSIMMLLQFLLDSWSHAERYTLSFTSVRSSADVDTATGRDCAHISTCACSNIGSFVGCAMFPVSCLAPVVKSILSPSVFVVVPGDLWFRVEILQSQAMTWNQVEKANMSVWCRAKQVWLWSIESAERHRLCQHPARLLQFKPENIGGPMEQTAATLFRSN